MKHEHEHEYIKHKRVEYESEEHRAHKRTKRERPGDTASEQRRGPRRRAEHEHAWEGSIDRTNFTAIQAARSSNDPQKGRGRDEQ